MCKIFAGSGKFWLGVGGCVKFWLGVGGCVNFWLEVDSKVWLGVVSKVD